MKSKIVKFYYRRLGFIIAWWYNLTQTLTGLLYPKLHLASFPTEEDLSRFIADNYRYEPDKWNGKLDTVAHPEVTYYNMRKDLPVGDCTDYAGMRLACLQKLWDPTHPVIGSWLGVVYYKMEDGSTGGHAVAVWKDEYYKWADYAYSRGLTTKWDWVLDYCEHRGKTPICAALVPVKRLHNGRVILGSATEYKEF